MRRPGSPGRSAVRGLALILWTLIAFTGCDSDNATTDPGAALDIPEMGLFPFSPGRKLVYNEFTLDSIQSQKVAGSDHRRTIHVEAALARNGKDAFLLLDSIYTPAGQLAVVESTYAAVENGNLYLEFDNAWGAAFDRSKKTNTTYAVGTLIDFSLGFRLPVPVDGTIRDKEAVSTPAGTFEAYKLELVGRVMILGNEVQSPRYYYFAEGVGIVRYVLPVALNPATGVNGSGTEMLLVSKNF